MHRSQFSILSRAIRLIVFAATKCRATAWAIAFLLIVQSRAQETWSASASPTSQNLWGTAWGANLFVAVGENGALLTSPDGLAWTARNSGTTNWLVGAAYASNQFVIVGDKGTLLTSPDGFTWTSRSSGTTERLNAAAFGNNRWLAVGENGAAVTSTDGTTWRAVPRADQSYWTSALSGWLRGLCFAYGSFVATGRAGHIVNTADADFFYDRSVATVANVEGVVFARHHFVAVGDGGLVLTSPDAATWRGSLAPTALRAIAFFNNTFVAAASNGSILSSPDAASWTVRGTGNSNLLTALATNPTTAVAVGFAGTILRASATPTAPSIIAPPSDLTEATGNHVLLTVTATGSAPLSYQWNFEGRPIPTATNDTLPLSSVTPAQAGRYTVTVTNNLGSATSTTATLTVVPAFPTPSDIFDSTFVSALPFNTFPSALLAQPDGKILVAYNNSVARLSPDGALDTTFASASLSGVVKIETLARQSDGKILVGGATSSDTAFLARLASDGTIDATFAPPALSGTSVTSFALPADGKILVANNTPRLVRLNPDGSTDATFAAADLAQFPNSSGVWPNVRLVALAPDGRIVVATSPATQNIGFFNVVDVLVSRLRTDGSLDPTFTPTRTGASVPQFLSVQSDGRILLGSEYNFGSFGSGSWKLQRLNADGTADPTFFTRSGSIIKYGGNMRAALDANGRIVVIVAWQNIGPTFKAMRFQADGTLDTTLRFENTSGSFTNLINTVLTLPDGRLLVSWQRGFARLAATNAPRINPPVALSDAPPTPATIAGGTDVTLAPLVAGTGAFAYSWGVFYADHSSQQPFVPASDSLTLSNVRTDGTIFATITNPAGTLAYPAQPIRVQPSAPVLVRAPAGQAVTAGRIAEISFAALGSGPLTYRWLLNGREINSGTSTPTSNGSNAYSASLSAGMLVISRVDATTAGTYQLILSNPLGSVTTNVTISIDDASRLADVATRGFVGTGDSALIAGFVVAGNTAKWVHIRGVGPGLAQFGLTDFLADPKLTLFDSSGAILEENDNWTYSADTYSAFYRLQTFALAEGSRDAIISRRLPPGNYTVRLSGVGGTTGTALAEIYEGLDDNPRLINLSSRVLVRTDEQIAISGVVITGQSPKKLLIRAVGPALAPFGVSNPLVDPSLTLVDVNGAAVTANNDWMANSNQAEIAAAAARVGAFPLASNSKDAAILVTLQPGSYTVLVSGVAGTTGVALVEVYEVP